MYKRFLSSLVLLLALGFWAAPASAAQFQGGESVTVSSSDDDVYAGGANVFVDGEIIGDLFAAGAIVRCNANVTQDVNMAGSAVDLFGNVGDDARVAGSMVTIGGNVEDDLLAAGAMVRVLPGSVIKGDLTIGGGSVMIDGTVEGNVLGGGGQIILNGEVKGAVMLEADEVQLGDNAKIGGFLQYTSSKDAKISEKASVAMGIDHKKPEPAKDKASKEWKSDDAKKVGAALFGLGVIAFLLRILILITTALIAVYFFKTHIQNVTKDVLAQFARNLGWGFVWLVVVPVAIILLLITILGAMISGFGLVIYGLTLLAAKLIAGIIFGSWLWKLFGKEKALVLNWKTIVVGIIVLNVIGLIPFLGWVFVLVWFLAALGGIVLCMKQTVK